MHFHFLPLGLAYAEISTLHLPSCIMTIAIGMTISIADMCYSQHSLAQCKEENTPTLQENDEKILAKVASKIHLLVKTCHFVLN